MRYVGSAEYKALKKFLSVARIELFGEEIVGTDLDPLLHLAELESQRPDLVQKSMRITVASMATGLLEAGRISREDLSEKLERGGAPSIEQVTALLSGVVARTLKQGQISSEEDFRILQSLVSYGAIDEAKLKRLLLLLDEFERC